MRRIAIIATTILLALTSPTLAQTRENKAIEAQLDGFFRVAMGTALCGDLGYQIGSFDVERAGDEAGQMVMATGVDRETAHQLVSASSARVRGETDRIFGALSPDMTATEMKTWLEEYRTYITDFCTAASQTSPRVIIADGDEDDVTEQFFLSMLAQIEAPAR